MSMNLTLNNEIKEVLKRPRDSHKGDYGRVLIIAGSKGLSGAAAMCAEGALRAGAGMVTVGVPESLNQVMEIKTTEAMTWSLPETETGSLAFEASESVLKKLDSFDVLVLGPGLSLHESTKKMVREIVVKSSIPMVLDADAINSLKDFKEILAKRKSFVIMTPHLKEFSRVFGGTIEEIKLKPESFAQEVSLKYDLVMTLKSHQTVVADKSDLYVNSTGNPGMSVGGSGDVLSGIIATFVSQKISGFKAAQYGVYLHGLAGDEAAEKYTQVSMLPRDIINCIPDVLKKCGL